MSRGCLHISLFMVGPQAAGEFDVQAMVGRLLKKISDTPRWFLLRASQFYFKEMDKEALAMGGMFIV